MSQNTAAQNPAQFCLEPSGQSPIATNGLLRDPREILGNSSYDDQCTSVQATRHGFEPIDVSGNNPHGLRHSENSTGTESGTLFQKSSKSDTFQRPKGEQGAFSSNDPDLADFVTLWPKLPDAVKDRLKAIVIQFLSEPKN